MVNGKNKEGKKVNREMKWWRTYEWKKESINEGRKGRGDGKKEERKSNKKENKNKFWEDNDKQNLAKTEQAQMMNGKH